jgi:hypothetical protein
LALTIHLLVQNAFTTTTFPLELVHGDLDPARSRGPEAKSSVLVFAVKKCS